jgi:hypothetical protein
MVKKRIEKAEKRERGKPSDQRDLMEEYIRAENRLLAMGCFGLVGCFFLLFALCNLIGMMVFPLSSSLLPLNQAFLTVGWICCVIGVSSLLFGLLSLKIPFMHRHISRMYFIPYMIALTGILASCSCILIIPQANMTSNSFVQRDVSLGPGSSLVFRNPADGVVQILCIGTNQRCDRDPENTRYVPSQLSQGLRIFPGQDIYVTFDMAGDYPITSQSTTNMNLMVHVVSNPPDGD